MWPSMTDAHSALENFLRHALIRKRDRYLGFIGKPKARAKFLDAIYHDLERDLDKSKQVQGLPAGAGSIPGFLFAPPKEFGTSVVDIRQILDSVDEGFLVVSEDGQYGIHGPEAMIDSRAIYRVTGLDLPLAT